MHLRILHLSDIHFSQRDHWRANPLLTQSLSCVRHEVSHGRGPDLIAITGDVAYRGSSTEYELAKAFIVGELLPAAGLGADALLMVPGNHDVQREACTRVAVQALERELREGGPEVVDKVQGSPEDMALLHARYANWVAFLEDLGVSHQAAPTWTVRRQIKGVDVRLAGLDTAWLHSGERLQGRLVLGRRALESALSGSSESDLVVALAHHPIDWLVDWDQRAVKPALQRRVDVLLRGHLHETEWSHTRSQAGQLVELPAGALYAGGDWCNSFQMLTLNPRQGYGEVRAWVWERRHEQWVLDRNATDTPDGCWRFPIRAPNSEFRQTTMPSPIVLRKPQPLGEPPDEPWPLLAPYEHPSQFGGRDQEIRQVVAEVGRSRSILCIYATSGAGKSSLLQAGLIPALRARGWNVTYDRHPAERGLARRILEGLISSPADAQDGEWRSLGSILARIREQAGRPAVVVLDQFEEVFLRGDTAKWLGPLLAATELGPPARAVRWVLAYRHEFHGRVMEWLRDPLRGASADLEGLPPRLDAPDQLWAWPLPPLGRRERHADEAWAERCFEEAIAKPLCAGISRWRFGPDGARRLASAFARARMKHPEDPLTPELQVVLYRLQQDSLDGRLEVPLDERGTDELLTDAMSDHIRRQLDEVARAADPEVGRARRTEALLLLDRLIDEAGRRRPIKLAELERELGPIGSKVLRALQRAGIWLVRCEDIGGEPWATLPHDHVASTVRDILSDHEQLLRLDLDPRRVDLWRLASGRSSMFAQGDAGAAVIDPTTVRALEQIIEALPHTDAMKRWWCAVQDAEKERQRRERLLALRSGDPETSKPLRSLSELCSVHGYPGIELLKALASGEDRFKPEQRNAVIGTGAWFLPEEERARVILPLVTELAPVAASSEEPESLWGALLSALDALEPTAAREGYEAVRQAMLLQRGQAARLGDVLDYWSPVISGRFLVGRFPTEATPGSEDEYSHEVVLSSYRLARFTVTAEQYRCFSPAYRVMEHDHPDHPAVRVNWYEARAFAAWAGGTLPTEHQWEVACRGGSMDLQNYSSACYAGNSVSDIDRVALHAGNRDRLVGGLGLYRATESLPDAPPHPLGLVHMLGNVYEWTYDWQTASPATGTSPPASPIGVSAPKRAVKGGSVGYAAPSARPSARFWLRPDYRFGDLGFRLALRVGGS